MRYILTISFYLILLNTYSQAGGLDSSFRYDGKVGVSLGTFGENCYAIAVQTDEKIIMVGGGQSASDGQNIGIMRLDKFGVEDSSFSNDARVVFDYDHSHDNARAVLIQPDGKILVTGEAMYTNGSDTTHYNYIVLRYLPNGNIDSSFGNNGFTIIDFAPLSDDEAKAIALQSDGKIVIGGEVSYGNPDFGLVRLNPNGLIDSTFGNNGLVITNFVTSSYCRGLAIQPDGKIIAAGYQAGLGYDVIVIRYKSNGELDSTFNSDGIYIQAFSNDNAAKAVALQPDGKIVVAGWKEANGTNKDILVFRFNSNGTNDLSFGTNGTVTTAIGNTVDDEIAYDLCLQSDGKILVCGQSRNGIYNDFCLLRYNPTGTLDNSFNGTGIVTTDFSNTNNMALGMQISPSGRIVLGGNNGFIAARYWTSGPVPFASFIANDQNVCLGQPVTFTNTSTGHPTSFLWNFPGGNPSTSNQPNPTIVYNSSGTYSVSLIASNGNGTDNVTYNSFITVSNNSLPIVVLTVPDSVCTSYGNILLNGGTPAGGSYSGPFVGTSYFNATSAGIGMFDIIYTQTTNGCTNSDTSSIFVSACLGLENTMESYFEIFPNPNDGNFIVKTKLTGDASLIDAYGQIITTVKLNQVENKIDMKGLRNGIYFLEISDQGNYIRKKIILAQ